MTHRRTPCIVGDSTRQTYIVDVSSQHTHESSLYTYILNDSSPPKYRIRDTFYNTHCIEHDSPSTYYPGANYDVEIQRNHNRLSDSVDERLSRISKSCSNTIDVCNMRRPECIGQEDTSSSTFAVNYKDIGDINDFSIKTG